MLSDLVSYQLYTQSSQHSTCRHAYDGERCCRLLHFVSHHGRAHTAGCLRAYAVLVKDRQLLGPHRALTGAVHRGLIYGLPTICALYNEQHTGLRLLSGD